MMRFTTTFIKNMEEVSDGITATTWRAICPKALPRAGEDAEGAKASNLGLAVVEHPHTAKCLPGAHATQRADVSHCVVVVSQGPEIPRFPAEQSL